MKEAEIIQNNLELFKGIEFYRQHPQFIPYYRAKIS